MCVCAAFYVGLVFNLSLSHVGLSPLIEETGGRDHLTEGTGLLSGGEATGNHQVHNMGGELCPIVLPQLGELCPMVWVSWVPWCYQLGELCPMVWVSWVP